MATVSRRPRSDALTGEVTSLWMSAQPSPGREMILPIGRGQLVLDYDAGVALVVGPRTRPALITTARTTIGISLTGVGLHVLTGLPARHLVDEVVDASAVWPKARWVRCLDHVTPAAMVDALEDEALRHAHRVPERARAVAAAEQAVRRGVPVEDICRDFDLDRRRLVPSFRDVVGLAPKQYQRIVRFQRSLQAMRSPHPLPLAQIAARFGYSDQAHLSREFKVFAGLTPSQVHGDCSPAHNHLSVPRIAPSAG